MRWREQQKKWNKIKLTTTEYDTYNPILKHFVVGYGCVLLWINVCACMCTRLTHINVCVHNQDHTETQQMYNSSVINPNFSYTHSIFTEMRKQ